MESTLVIIKPNVMRKGLAGEVIQKLQSHGLSLSGLKLMKMRQPLLDEFYKEHADKPFFPALSQFMRSCPVAVLVLSGDRAAPSVRELMGDTDPKKAGRRTLRFQYGDSIGENGLHGSDSQESAKREIPLFFTPEELFLPPQRPPPASAAGEKPPSDPA